MAVLAKCVISVAPSKTILLTPFQFQQREEMHRRVYPALILKNH